MTAAVRQANDHLCSVCELQAQQSYSAGGSAHNALQTSATAGQPTTLEVVAAFTTSGVK
jgi:hypothetical protein